MGAFLDGIPEQAVLGIGIAGGSGVSTALMVAIFVSNLPEAIGSSNDMHEAGASRKKIFLLWVAVAAVCALSTVAGFTIADLTSGSVRGAIDGFAAGALLVMLVDSLIPEANEKAGLQLVSSLSWASLWRLDSATVVSGLPPFTDKEHS